MRSVLGAVVATLLLVVPLFSHSATAHGSMKKPISRVYNCYLQNPDNPTSPACKAAVALSSKHVFQNWSAVSIEDAAGRHRQLIPDGKLCSGGGGSYAGLDLARADWETSALTSGAKYTFLYKAAVPHRGFFEFYVTKDGYDPTQALKWSSLEDRPFLNVTDPPLLDGDYRIHATTPARKSGRHLIYVIWQRSDKAEAFYSCSDVVFHRIK